MPTIAQLQDLLRTIRAAFPGSPAIIAGGAPRDILNGREVKDIDVFIENDGCAMWNRGIDKLAKQFYAEQSDDVGGDVAEGYDSSSTIAEIISLDRCPLRLPVQLIRLEGEDPIDHVAGFDFGLCMVFITENRVRWLPPYLKDYANQTITRLGKSKKTADLRRNAKHLERLLAKYPTWKPRNCGVLRQYRGI